MRDCTCVGSCRGAKGLGVGWNCVVENGSVEDARRGDPSTPVERPRNSPEKFYRVEVHDHDGLIVAIEPRSLTGRNIGPVEDEAIRCAIRELRGFIGGRR